MSAFFRYLFTSVKALLYYALGRPLGNATPWHYVTGVLCLLATCAFVLLLSSLLLSKKHLSPPGEDGSDAAAEQEEAQGEVQE